MSNYYAYATVLISKKNVHLHSFYHLYLESVTALPFLVHHHAKCYIDNQTILRPPMSWIGYYHNNSTDGTANKSGVLLHQHCPFDYCASDWTYLTINNTDAQCVFNCSGILCGGCKPGLSLTLGRPLCQHCSNRYIALLASFAGAGVALQSLQAKSDWKIFSCVDKLKPLFDAYSGPYQDKYCFWTGFLLLVRNILYLVFVFNTLGDPSLNLLVVILTSLSSLNLFVVTLASLSLTVLFGVFHRVYKKRYCT